MLLEILTDPDTRDRISGHEIAQRMGVQKWGAVSTNAMTPKVKRAPPNIGWVYETKLGPGGGSWFIKTSNGVLKPQRLEDATLEFADRRGLAAAKPITVKPHTLL
jgi:hypothetical protein